jgi:methylated-DNA-[protein]-cysteine S-methyltransferase
MKEKKEKLDPEKVYELLKTVPKGKVTTYKELALQMNSKGYRAIGKIMNKNPYAPIVPCHRVINVDGKLGGFAFGLEKKKNLLLSEGIEITNGKIDLKKFGHSFE